MENFCMFFEEALQVAIKGEEDAFNTYYTAIKKVDDKGAKTLLKELAKDELEHKHKLELALLDEEAIEDLGGGKIPEGFSLADYIQKRTKYLLILLCRIYMHMLLQVKKNQLNFTLH